MEILSYTASFTSTVLGLFEPFCKKMKNVLVLNFIGNVLVGLSYFCVSKYSGAAICMVAAIQLLINYSFTVRGKKVPLALMAVHAAVFLAVNIVTFKAWYDVLALMAALLFVLSVAQHTPKYYRIIYIANSLLWIVYDLLAAAYGNLVTHTVLSAAIALAIWLRDMKQK